MKTYMAVSHVSLDLSLRNKGCNRVNDHDVHGSGTYHGLCDLKCLLAVIRLGNIKVINIYTDILGIDRIKCMLCINESCDPAALLNLCNHVECNGCLTTGFRSVDLDDTSLRNAAYTECDIQSKRACRNRLYLHMCTGISQFHYRALAILLLDMSKCCLQCLLFLFVYHTCGSPFF